MWPVTRLGVVAAQGRFPRGYLKELLPVCGVGVGVGEGEGGGIHVASGILLPRARVTLHTKHLFAPYTIEEQVWRCM